MSLHTISVGGSYVTAAVTDAPTSLLSYRWLSQRSVNHHLLTFYCEGSLGERVFQGAVDVVYDTGVDMVVGKDVIDAYNSTAVSTIGRIDATSRSAEILLSSVGPLPLSKVRHSDIGRSYVSRSWLSTYLPAISSLRTVYLDVSFLGRSGLAHVHMPFAVLADLSFDFIVGLDARAFYYEVFPIDILQHGGVELPSEMSDVSGKGKGTLHLPSLPLPASEGVFAPSAVYTGRSPVAGTNQGVLSPAELFQGASSSSAQDVLSSSAAFCQDTSLSSAVVHEHHRYTSSDTLFRGVSISESERDIFTHTVCRSMFLGRSVTGLHTKLYTRRSDVLHAAMMSHGLETDTEGGPARLALLTHFLTGQCVATQFHSNQKALACKEIREGYSSAAELSIVALRFLVDSDNTALRQVLNDTISAIGLTTSRRPLHEIISCYMKELQDLQDIAVLNILPRLPLLTLRTLAKTHDINVNGLVDRDQFHRAVNRHFASGMCIKIATESHIVNSSYSNTDNDIETMMFKSTIRHIPNIIKCLKKRSLLALMTSYQIDMPPPRSNDKPHNARSLRKNILLYFQILKRGKRFDLFKADMLANAKYSSTHSAQSILDRLSDIHEKWPQKLSDTEKNDIVSTFKEETGSLNLRTFTCCSCSARYALSKEKQIRSNDIDLSVITSPDSCWPGTSISLPYIEGALKNVQIDSHGVDSSNLQNPLLSFCSLCFTSIQHNKVPRLSLANGTFLGELPKELQDLTAIEESMIALCRAKITIIQLQEERVIDTNSNVPGTQRGFKGNIIIFPQDPSTIAQILPPSVIDIASPLCVIFVGSEKPTMEWLQKHAKPLAVNGARVRKALVWLKANNILYRDIIINTQVLSELEANPILPIPITHVLPSEAGETLTSRYDTMLEPGISSEESLEIPFDKVVITSLTGGESAFKMKQKAMSHIHENRGAYISVSHDPLPANEFQKPELYPMMYPTLFPYGIGGLQDPDRQTSLGMKNHVRHLFNLNDKRFQEHSSFLFTAFNMIQRHHLLLFTHLRVKRADFPRVAQAFANVSSKAIESVMERMSSGKDVVANNKEETEVLRLMKEVKAVTAKIPGTSSARATMRNEIRGMIVDKGLPSFYLTINPSDTYNPIVKFLAQEEIDIDNLPLDAIPKYSTQSILVANNPFLAAKFFDKYLSAFFKTVLSFNPREEGLNLGILGHTKAYYGCVEAQGRGTLHCHLMVWLEGSLNPDEIKQRIKSGDTLFRDRLLAFLDDTISTTLPIKPDCNDHVPISETVHPCAVRGHQVSNISSEVNITLKQRDLHNLVKKCQVHAHTKTCFKYCKPGDPRICRFNLGEENIREHSTFDYDTGELSLQCLDGLVNDFNDTIMECVRCNMDIKFIGSGASAKAVLYYITDYITKSQLTTHVAYAALAEAVKKLEIYNPNDDEITQRGKKLIQKCAYSILSRQELSAQQVASYVLGLPNHYTSYEFNQLYWLGFEQIVEQDFTKDDSINIDEDSSVLSTNKSNNQEEINELRDSDNNLNEENIENDDSVIEEEDMFLSPIHISAADIFEENQEVIMSRDNEGNLTTRATRYADYLGRGSFLRDISLWEYTARVVKQKISSKKCFINSNRDDDTYNDEEEEEEIIDSKDEWSSLTSALIHSGRYRPSFKFSESHTDFATFKQVICHPSRRKIPVPIGPAIPRRTNPAVFERYCCLMLILFKPWESPSDLRKSTETWSETFSAFKPSAHAQNVIDNMQILHECKESRDDHFNNRKNCSQPVSLLTGTAVKTYDDDFQGEYDIDAAIVAHLKDIDSSFSQRKLNLSLSSSEAVNAATRSGLFKCDNLSTVLQSNVTTTSDTIINAESANIATSEEVLIDVDMEKEPVWSLEYERRRINARKLMMRTDDISLKANDNNSSNLNIQNSSISNIINLEEENIASASIQVSFIKTPEHDIIDLETVVRKWTLNAEQAYAFRIIVNQSINSNKSETKPLRMFLDGQGGTGKSRVIEAVQDYFLQCSQSRRLRLTSFTGVAARNIKGTTLHAALFLSQNKKKNRSKTLEDLRAAWLGVDFLFIDEVSMIGTTFLKKIHDALADAKDCTDAFGGINIIFAGDFSQLPPVRDSKLYGYIKDTTSQYVQDRLQGKLLWYSVDTVVTLRHNMRQQEDQVFSQLLQRVREGMCNIQDYALLQTRIISLTNQPNDSFTPIIVSTNEAKDALNIRSAEAFAQRTGRALHYYYSEDVHNKTPVSQTVRELLAGTNSGQTENRMSCLPLVLGMPIMITQNFDVLGGVVNGSMGILEGIRYRLDEENRRILVSCIAKVDGMTGDSLSTLLPGRAAIMPDTVDITFTHPHSSARLCIKRTQVPIMPGFAITAHKAQGQTMNTAIVDLHDCSVAESPYVMLSRVKTLKGLFILRDFSLKKIQVRRSEDFRREGTRIGILELETTVLHGTNEEKSSAEASLALIESACGQISSGSSEDDRSQRALVNIQKQVMRLDRIENRVDITLKRKAVVSYPATNKKIKLKIPPLASKNSRKK